MGKQVQRIMVATSASLIVGESIIFEEREKKGVNGQYIRPQSDLNDYEGGIGAVLDACGVQKSADT